MPKQRVLSGKQLIRIFRKFGFEVHTQRGSHIKVRRTSSQGDSQTLMVPNHSEIDKGTLAAIYTEACEYIPENMLRSHFYTSRYTILVPEKCGGLVQ